MSEEEMIEVFDCGANLKGMPTDRIARSSAMALVDAKLFRLVNKSKGIQRLPRSLPKPKLNLAGLSSYMGQVVIERVAEDSRYHHELLAAYVASLGGMDVSRGNVVKTRGLLDAQVQNLTACEGREEQLCPPKP